MNQQTLIMDLDDTLIHCRKYFIESKNLFADLMLDWFHLTTKEEILAKQLEIDIKNVEEFGLHSSLYPESLILTYKYFCVKYGRRIKEEEIEQVWNIGQRVFQIEVQPFPYLYEVLEKLQDDGHELYLFTGGDEKNQKRKIDQLGLEPYFRDRMFISEHKNLAALRFVLDEIKTEKKYIWMVGNSLKTDISPAIELGINAIHIPAEIEWSYNIVDIDIKANGAWVELQSLLQLPEYLRDYAFYQIAK